MPPFPLIALLRAAVLLVAVALPGCGDSGFEGDVDVPNGYATYRGDATVSVEEVAVPGARKALRGRIELPGDGSPSTREAVDVLAADGRHRALSAGAPDDQGDAVDAGAVVDSLRLEGS